METIGALPSPAMNTPCCHQGANCECFRHWAASSVVDGTVRCWYCRTLFPAINYVFVFAKKERQRTAYDN